MQQEAYEKAILAMSCWRLARTNDTNELLAIACTLRNWLVRRPFADQRGLIYFDTYISAIESFMSVCPLRDMPRGNEPAMIDPSEGLLRRIDGVYDCSQPDITSNHANPQGARYFGPACEIGNGTWFDTEVLQRQGVHQLVGTFGGQQFFT